MAKTKSEIILLGTVATIERNHEQMDIAKQGDEVCVKIENTTGDAPKLYGRHFTHEDPLISKVELCFTAFIHLCFAIYNINKSKK